MNSKPNLTYAEFIQKVKETKAIKFTQKKQKQHKKQFIPNQKQLSSTNSNAKMQTEYTPQKKGQVNIKGKPQFGTTMNLNFDQSNKKGKNKDQIYCLTERLGSLPSDCRQKINKKSQKQKENYEESFTQRQNKIKRNNNQNIINQTKGRNNIENQTKNAKINKNLLLKNTKKNNFSTFEVANVKKKPENIQTIIKSNNFRAKKQNHKTKDQFYTFSNGHQSQVFHRNLSYLEEVIPQTTRQKSYTNLTQKSFQCLYNKFIHQIKEILTQITKIQVANDLLNHKISYIQYLQALKEMKMIQKDYEPYGPKNYAVNQVDLVRQLWEEIVCGHNINHLILVLGVILKIGTSTNMQSCAYLQQKYENFRFTKLQLTKAKTYTQKDSVNFYNYPFKPYISKKSQQLASRSKSRQKKYKIQKPSQTENYNISFTQRQNTSFSTQFDCTNVFNQKSVCSPTNYKQSLSPLGNKRSQILYKNAKQKSMQKRIDKSTVDYEYQKNKNQLTFKPKVILKKKTQQKLRCDQIQKVSGQQKSINRMIRGRVQKEIKQIAIDKGIPYNQKIIQKMIKNKYNQLIMAKNHAKSQNMQSFNYFQRNILQRMQAHNNHQEIIKNQSNYKMPSLFQQFNNNNSLDSFSQSPIFKSPINTNKFNQQNQEKKIQKRKIQNHSNYCSQQKLNEIFKEQVEEFQQDVSRQNFDDFIILDIYLEEDKCQKLLIRRDSTPEELYSTAQQFIKKNNLSAQMQQKLKQSLMKAMKFYNLQKIDEDDELYQEDTSQLQVNNNTEATNDSFSKLQ